MSNYYEKKQAEIQEEVDFLLEEKKQRRAAANKLFEQIYDLKEELKDLAKEEKDIIDRLNSIRDSGAKFYGVDLENGRVRASHGSYYVNDSISRIEMLAKDFKREVDTDE